MIVVKRSWLQAPASGPAATSDETEIAGCSEVQTSQATGSAQYRLEGSTDGTTWTQLASGGGGWTTWVVRTPVDSEYRRFRLVCDPNQLTPNDVSAVFK